ncbi:S-layer homology domain-containing protein [Brevibacillus fluminis]|uniref:S-layer homology domain-containing protein n=1 Tax=Brevibacillus fluminis TaxID=511487 RepID=UPI003F8CBD37
MYKKLAQIFLIFALMLTMVPVIPLQANAAFGDNNSKQQNFIFPDVVPKVNYKYITMTGTLNQVSSSGITYSVKNVSANVETTPTSRGVSVSEDGSKITVANIELFDGDNTITFRGKQGTTEVVNTYEITYISTPLLYNLQFTGGGKKMTINPTDKTIVTSDFTSGDSYFTIEGNAPNVTSVIIKNGTESASGTVSQDSEAYFIVGKVPLKKGANTLTFLLKNSNQTIEVKRDIVYFDGTGTFYDVNMTYPTTGTTKFDLSQKPAIKGSDSSGSTAKGVTSLEGYVIIAPEARLPVGPAFDPNNPANIVKIALRNESASPAVTEDIDNSKTTYTKVAETSSYYIFKFNVPVAGFAGNTDKFFAQDQQVYVKLGALNLVESYKSDQTGAAAKYDDQTVRDFGYMFVDPNAPAITSLSYALGVSTTYTPLIDNTIINEKPFTLRLNVTNDVAGKRALKVVSTNSFGNQANVTFGTPVYGTGTIDLPINSLPFDGTQTLKVYYNNNIWQEVKVNAAAGPVLKFTGLTDGMVFKYNPNMTSNTEGYAIKQSAVTTYLVKDILKSLAGQLDNITIDPLNDYKKDPVTKKKAITLTINNSDVNLKQNGSSTNSFIIDNGGATDYNATVSKYFHDGQNTVVFLYDKNNLVYEKRFTVTLYSNSYPEIPVANTDGVYPFNTSTRKPDPKFVGKDGVFTTKETEMKIAGTFNFIDLGDSVSDAQSVISSIGSGKYILTVEGPDGFNTITWDLQKNTLLNGSTPVVSGKTDVSGIDVYYDFNKHYFIFEIAKQQIPTDGSKVVYTFSVYNNGLTGGSKATYRLEVSAPGVAYKVLRPVKTGLQTTVNQNYVEVVIESKNTEKVVVNKTEAKHLSTFDDDLDGRPDTTDAFRAIVTDLKPNKSNKITFTITRGKDTVTDSIDVFYAPSYIPGAQYMSPMDKAGKVFDGKLTLTFPKNTYLIRNDFNVPENLKGQVFKGHNILYAVANSEDGVVDRFDYLVDRPKNFDDTIKDLGRQFKNSFDSHFIKASQVYWIDAGMADDPSSDEYDPYTYGMLPIMPDAVKVEPKLYNFDGVPKNRMVVPNNRGSLELAYDANIVPDAANNLTVMRYDPKRYYWENLGGVVNTGKKTIKVPFDKFGYYVVAKLNDSFADVVHHSYARNHIEAMFSKGVILSKSSVEFAPDLDTTRGEFAAMVVRALQLPLVENISKPSFDDVLTDYTATSLYDYRHIETAAKLGIVRGTDPRIFNPQGKVTRAEAAVILARALKLKLDTSQVKVTKDLSKLFKDYNLITDEYAKPSILAIAKLKLISGSPVDVTDPKKGYVFEPNATIIRSDAAILMARVMAYLKTIPPVYEVK